MFYTIYKTTNVINGKYYIGKHQTENLNDDYIGSGKLLNNAIKKYGAENFHKEILHICESESEMNTLEKILVVPDREINYNLCPGGQGGWGYVNKIGRNKKYTKEESMRGVRAAQYKWKNDPEWAQKQRERLSRQNKGMQSFLGKQHTEETKKKIGQINSFHQSGSKNSQYGTCWITNGTEVKKIKKDELDFWLSLGYNRGRNLLLKKPY
jgi:hypothetical protein